MTLTEKWKKGELPEGEKYIQLRDNRIFTAYFNGKEFREVYNSDIKEVLAPVPTYNEYLESEAHCAVYSEENKQLKAEIERLQFENQHVIWLKHRNEALDKDNKQLRQLLKECKDIVSIEKDFASCHFEKYRLDNLLTKIDNAIGEKK